MSPSKINNVKEFSARLKKCLSRQWKGHELRAAYLFGSTVTGHGWKTVPDVDVAIVFAPGYRLEEGERLREELAGSLDTNVDLVVLNESSALLWFEVLRNGRLIWCADESERVEQEVNSLIHYYDLEPQRQRLAKDIQTLIREGVF